MPQWPRLIDGFRQHLLFNQCNSMPRVGSVRHQVSAFGVIDNDYFHYDNFFE